MSAVASNCPRGVGVTAAHGQLVQTIALRIYCVHVLATRYFTHIFAHNGGLMPKFEDDRRKIVSRLESEGWHNIGGGEHDNFVKAGHRKIQVPRHRVVTQGVARSIAKAAGWK
jgi:predicted RNA binding protein YcfA (HicA-like mRNA interferase family)